MEGKKIKYACYEGDGKSDSETKDEDDGKSDSETEDEDEDDDGDDDGEDDVDGCADIEDADEKALCVKWDGEDCEAEALTDEEKTECTDNQASGAKALVAGAMTLVAFASMM